MSQTLPDEPRTELMGKRRLNDMILYVKKKLIAYNVPISRFLDNNSGTIWRTLVYTLGHFIIAAVCVWYFTGAQLIMAVSDAIVEPLINGVWYFVLDKFWASRSSG